MKKLILILSLAFITCASSQNGITFVIYQDAKLATMTDNHGNEPFTLDITIKSKWQGMPSQIGFLEVQLSNEYADLASGYYNRYSGGFAYVFTPKDWLMLGLGANYGFISRKTGTSDSFEFVSEVIIPISPRFSLNALNTLTQRTDGNRKFRHNFAVGIEYRFEARERKGRF